MASSPEPTDVDALFERVRRVPRSEQEEAAAAAAPVKTRVLYRLLREPRLAPTDFRSNLAKCFPRRGPELADPSIWAGLSMYDTVEQAERTARRYRGRVGAYLAVMHMPEEDSRILIRPTLTAGHFTVMGCEEIFPMCVYEVRSIIGLST